MSIRRVGKADSPVSSAKSRSVDGVSGEIFARHLADIAAVQEPETVDAIAAAELVTAVGDREPTPHQRREQLLQTGELLDSLAALGRDIAAIGKNSSMELRSQLQKTRDLALRTLSDSPSSGLERDLLHRTTVLATVELAKSDRGDYK